MEGGKRQIIPHLGGHSQVRSGCNKATCATASFGFTGSQKTHKITNEQRCEYAESNFCCTIALSCGVCGMLLRCCNYFSSHVYCRSTGLFGTGFRKLYRKICGDVLCSIRLGIPQHIEFKSFFELLARTLLVACSASQVFARHSGRALGCLCHSQVLYPSEVEICLEPVWWTSKFSLAVVFKRLTI